MLNQLNRETIFGQLVEKVGEILPMMPSSGNVPTKTYDILDLQFARLELQVQRATDEELKIQLAEMICWMVIILEESRLKNESKTLPAKGMSRAAHYPKARDLTLI